MRDRKIGTKRTEKKRIECVSGKMSRRLCVTALAGMLMLCLTGCTSNSEVTYKNGKMAVTTYTFDGNVAMLEKIKDNPAGLTKMKDGLYAEMYQDSFSAKKLQNLSVTQKTFTFDDLEYNGAHYTAQKAMDIITQEGDIIGKITSGQQVQVLYFVGDLAVVLANKDYGFIPASNLTDAAGTVPQLQPISAGPYLKPAVNGVHELEIANQQLVELNGSKVNNIIIDTSVTAEVFIDMDFDMLTLNNKGVVYVHDCKDGQIVNLGGAKLTVDKNASVGQIK